MAEAEARLHTDKIRNIVEGQGYMLAHAASETGVSNLISVLGLSEGGFLLSSNAVRRAGGFDDYLRNVTTLLKNPDSAVRAFAAVWLGALGDRRAATNLFVLLQSKDLPVEAKYLEGCDRAGACIGLGLLGAAEYASQLAQMLESTNQQARSGAAFGLGYMKAKQFAPRLAKMLSDESDQVVTAAVSALAEMNSKESASEIATLLTRSESRDPAVQQSALYALAVLKANEQANVIAPLLEDKFRNGDAALALALMGETQRAPEIAELLKSTKALSRSSALLALGILKAKAFEQQVVACLDDREEFVRTYAAWSLVMMESHTRLPEVLTLTSKSEGIFSVGGKGPAQIATDEFRRERERAGHSRLALKNER